MSNIKKINKKIKKLNNKQKIVIVLVLALFVVLLTIFFIFKSNSSLYNRCTTDEYNISDKTFNKVKKELEDIEKVNSVKVFKNVCSIKIIINLKEDIELDIIKEKMNKVIDIFGETILSEYDVLLYVNSDNKDSSVYPLNVAKNKNRENFVW